MATDADENDMLTYTLWWGDSSDNLSKTDITATGRSGQSVILEKSGLSNDTRYWFKVVVSDGIDEVASGEGNENTYCLGSYCSGGGYSYPTCTGCSGTGKVDCTASGCVNGYITSGTKACTNCDSGYTTCGGLITLWDFGSMSTSANDWICDYCHLVMKIPTVTVVYPACTNQSACRYGINLSNGFRNAAGYTHPECASAFTRLGTDAYPSYGATCYRSVKCRVCDGTKEVPNLIICTSCKGSGQIQHSACSGNGYRTVPYYCSAHSQRYAHYYCTSNSHHGDNISQYHK
ncbi:MAG: hypothetical protein HFJ24_07530 [Clostridia bacterium]|nr:hypothetical protein [Clostridia bacterium]